MDSRRFDDLTRAVAASATRRSLLREVAAGAAGVVLALSGVAQSDDLTAEAKKGRNNNNNRNNKNKNKKKDECSKNDDCSQPSNPCEKKVCQGGMCKKETRQDGASCGSGQVCANGQCGGGVNPTPGPICPAGQTQCLGVGCVNTSDDVANCGTCGVACGLDQPCQSSQCANCGPSGTTCAAHGDCCTGRCTCGSQGGHCQENTFFQGFEQNTDNWVDNGSGIAITRVPSGTDGIDASSGSFFAELATGTYLSGTTAFTRWGGFSMSFPPNGFTTEVDVYLNPDPALFSGTPHFDYTVAITQPTVCVGDPGYHSEFVMRYGKGTVSGGGTAFCMSSSAAGTGYAPGGNPCEPPVSTDMVIFTGPAGWYTYRHEFKKNASNFLEVTMKVLDQQGNTVGSWHRTGLIANPGGSRYGWFSVQEFPFLAIDNSTRTT